nr:MurR/RpiR family transcriptional regulator [uncultured Fretibacterium sp.]
MNIKERIRQKSAKMSGVQKRLAACVLDAFDEVAFMTASQLGKFARVSEASVVRFVRLLGFERYQDFRADLSQTLMDRLSTTERSKDIHVLNPKGFYDSILDKELKALNSVREDFDEKKLEEMGSLLASASAVYVCSARSSFTIGYYLSFYLSWFLPRVRSLERGNAYEELAMAPQSSVVVGISFPRYTKWTVDMLRFAHERGLTVAALTDDMGSPLAEYAACALTMPYRLVSFIDSLVVPLSMVNCLILSTFRATGGEGQERLEKLEAIWKAQDVYIKRT